MRKEGGQGQRGQDRTLTKLGKDLLGKIYFRCIVLVCLCASGQSPLHAAQ